VAAVRQLPALIQFSEAMAARSQVLKSFLLHQLYRHPQVMHTTRLAQQVVQELFAIYQAQPAEMTEGFAARSTALAGTADEATARARVVADYIAGMTDRFATREHDRLSGQRLLP
jgi:dGTPase